MVAKVLVDADIEAGRKLIEGLDAAKVPIKAALWLYLPEFQRYQLMLASSVYDQAGPLEAYRTLVDVLRTLSPDDKSRLQSVNIVGESDPLVNSLRTMVRLDPGTSGIRYSGSPGREYIDDAWIYRLN